MMPEEPSENEPLRNIELESALMGLRMALTPEEESDARRRFLELLLESTLVVPTLQAVPTLPNGAIAPDAPISPLVVKNADGIEGVAAFSTVGGLGAALPQAKHAVFLTGGELGMILANGPHPLFVTGLDVHVEVGGADLQMLAQATHQAHAALQEAAQRNRPLEEALAAYRRDDRPDTREAVATAFMSGFCRIPVADDQDGNPECVVLGTQDPNMPEIALLTESDGILCFTGEQALQEWTTHPRNAIALPGPEIIQIVTQAQIEKILVNPGGALAETLQVQKGRVVLV